MPLSCCLLRADMAAIASAWAAVGMEESDADALGRMTGDALSLTGSAKAGGVGAGLGTTALDKAMGATRGSGSAMTSASVTMGGLACALPAPGSLTRVVRSRSSSRLSASSNVAGDSCRLVSGRL
jgi:hypothetical protein